MVRARKPLAVFVLASLVVPLGCSSPPEGPQPVVLVEDPTIPKPIPRGPLAAAPAAPATEERGLAGPEGTLGAEAYRKRRKAVLAKIGASAALVMQEAAYEGNRRGMDFYYLTGIEEEAGAALLLNGGERTFKEHLFLARADVEEERWSGERALLPSRALEVATGIAKLHRAGQLLHGLVDACGRVKSLTYVGELTADKDRPKAMELYTKATDRTYDCKVIDQHDLLARLREVKDADEVALMRTAIRYTAAGHQAALKAVKPGAHEFEVKDAIEDAFRRAGSRHVAYESITGSGPNGAVLHYPKDNRVMKADETIVIDAAAEAEKYAADVTRTLPVGGKFTKEQREIYDIVLRAQQAGIAAAKAGATVDDIDAATRKVIADAGYYDYYLHSCCHFVGLEVHDPGEYKLPLPAGAVLTIEPGIYLPQRGFGVRIEDEVLITQTGAEVLTSAIPKDPDELERLMAEAKKTP